MCSLCLAALAARQASLSLTRASSECAFQCTTNPIPDFLAIRLRNRMYSYTHSAPLNSWLHRTHFSASPDLSFCSPALTNLRTGRPRNRNSLSTVRHHLVINPRRKADRPTTRQPDYHAFRVWRLAYYHDRDTAHSARAKVIALLLVDLALAAIHTQAGKENPSPSSN